MKAAGLRILVAIALAAIAVLALSPSFGEPVRWTPDGLFYQSQMLQLRGVDHDAAVAQAFRGPIAAELRVVSPDQIGDPAWVAYNERFYERRLTVPAAAAVLQPAWGDRAVLNVSMAGYVACVLAIFGLLLLRFRLLVAAAVTLATIALPILSHNAQLPLTDSWGLAFETAALGAALLTLDRGLRWIPLWIGAILLLSLTRDATWIPLLGVAFAAWRTRSRVGAVLAGTGLGVALPVALAFPVPVRELLASGLSDHSVNPDASWGWIAARFPGAIVDLVRSDLGFVRQGELYSGLYLALGLVLLFALLRGPGRDHARALMKAGAGVALAYTLAVPVFSALRLELIFVPMAAFGLAAGAERLVALTRGRATAFAHRRPGGVTAVDVP